MRKYLLFVILLASAINMIGTPVTSLPYFCDFESSSENAQWVLNRRSAFGASTPLPSSWTINTGAKHSGINGLYIFTTADGSNETIAEYDGSHEVFAIAEREFSLPVGTYNLAIDWRCLGDTINDAIFVYWGPASSLTSLNSRTTSSLPTNLTPLSFDGKNYLSGQGAWQQARTNVNISSSQTYKLVIAWRNNTTNTYNPGACIDNVQLQTAETITDCWHTVTNMQWTTGQTTDILSWQGQAGATYDIYYWLEGSIIVDSVMNVTGTSYAFNHGILKSGLYCFAIRTHCGDMSSILVELLGAKSLGDYSLVAEACPDVNLKANAIISGEKFMTPSCDAVGAYTIKPTVVVGGGSIAGYRVDAISYSDCPFPFNLDSAKKMMKPGNYTRQITTDDVWDSQVLQLPFKVCFFEGTYSQAVVCSNGIVSFDTQVAGKSAGWDLKAQPDIPSPDFGAAQGSGQYWRNAIYGVFQDYDPAYGGTIWYGVLGEWPCRKMVVVWDQVPMFSNHSTINSSMIVMYEGTNVIDVYVKNRALSPSGWNDNRGIIGLQNADGSDGVCAPRRNTTDGDLNGRSWSAQKEAWRFTPYATPTYTLTWYNGAFNTPTDIDNFIESNPDSNIELGRADSITINESDGILDVTVRLQYSQCNGDYIDILDYAHISWPHTDTIDVDTFFCAGKSYTDKYINYADTAGFYQTSLKNTKGCDSVIYRLNLSEKPVSFSERYDTICEGDFIIVEGIRLSKSGDYPITLNYSDCACDSTKMTVHLLVSDLADFNVEPFGQICADDQQVSVELSSTAAELVFSIFFDAKGHRQGLQDIVSDTIRSTDDIAFELPENIRPDIYTALIKLESFGCGSMEQQIEFMVNYPSSITPVKWDNVIPVLNKDYNGGYTFSAYQWYRNGQPIEGEVGSYFRTPNTLGEGDYYQVALTREGEDYAILSCPVYYNPTPVGETKVDTLPRKVVIDGQLYIIHQGVWYNALGTQIKK